MKIFVIWFKNKLNKKTFIIWVIGFVVLFLIDIVVESLLLPYWGLDNSSENDIYFKLWWVVVAIWFLFGLTLITYFESKKRK
jgi:hypothetical protein